jgi:hypothetical protein
MISNVDGLLNHCPKRLPLSTMSKAGHQGQLSIVRFLSEEAFYDHTTFTIAMELALQSWGK